MSLLEPAIDGIAGALFAAMLATLPNFDAARRGWFPRFGWFFVRYALPLSSTLVVALWFVLRR